ncbi:hypothetical protein BC831DRAFT_449924 [Entophlyctis helioformis]|nr:hypothetical protein BC831DRAFT_449924 [Entophlyctis helioformis]
MPNPIVYGSGHMYPSQHPSQPARPYAADVKHAAGAAPVPPPSYADDPAALHGRGSGWMPLADGDRFDRPAAPAHAHARRRVLRFLGASVLVALASVLVLLSPIASPLFAPSPSSSFPGPPSSGAAGRVVSGISAQAYRQGLRACAAINSFPADTDSAGSRCDVSGCSSAHGRKNPLFETPFGTFNASFDSSAGANANANADASVDADRHHRHRHRHAPPHTRARNPRVGLAGTDAPAPVLLTHATLWDGDGSVYEDTDILLRNGLIARIGKNLRLSNGLADLKPSELNDLTTIDAAGRFVTPGLVDLHSHMGLDSWPALRANSDTNEGSPSRTLPQLRSLDGFNPWDKAIKIINSGGVTTSLVLPGSRNLMGGEAFAFKHRYFPSNRAEDMLLNAGLRPDEGKAWRWMKMACGENPKNVDPGVASGPIFPETRLGEGFLFREYFEKATTLKQSQEDWCARAETAKTLFGASHAHEALAERFPTDLSLDSLVSVLRGDVLLNVHCYETYDLEMFVRLTHEYNFKVAAFHHALEAWEVADMLAKEGIATALFADHWGYKREAYDSSTKASKILTDKGVRVVFKSDHPVLNAQHLVYEAAKAHHYGLSAKLAIQAVTSVPAQLLGQGDRLGRLQPGYDADVVLWDRSPLDIGAHPLKVYVDGYETFEHPNFAKDIATPFDATILTEESAKPKNWNCAIPNGADKTYTLENIGAILATRASEPSSPSDRIVIENGIVTCIGECEPKGDVVDLNGFWVTPGLVAAGVHLGLEEISAELITSSGKLDIDVNADGSVPKAPSAKDSLQIGRHKSKMLDAAFKAGVTSAVSQLRYKGVPGGDNVVFRTGGVDSVDDVIPTSFETRNFHVGSDAMRSNTHESSISGQLDVIRRQIAQGNAEHIAIQIQSAQSIRKLLPSLDETSILVGASEAWRHAGQLKSSILLLPARCTPSTWETRECREPSRVPSGYSILKDNNVNVGLGVPEDNFVRGLIWEAGWAVSDRNANLTDFEFAKESVGLVSWNLAEAYGFLPRTEIAVGRPANLVVYDNVPGTLKAHVRAVVDTTTVECQTVQD